jgi:integrase
MAGPVLASCDQSACGRRDRALLLSRFAGALRRSELVALQVEDVAVVVNGLRLRIARGKTDRAGQGARSACHGGGTWRPVRSARSRPGRPSPSQAGPLFRMISTGDGIGDTALHPDAVRLILARRVRMGVRPAQRARCASASSPPPMTKGRGDHLTPG